MPTRYMIFPYTQNSAGGIAIAGELEGQRILRQGSKYSFREGDVIINWGASDCPYKQALNYDNKAVLNKLAFFAHLSGKGLTPNFATTIGQAANLQFPVFCRTEIEGKDGSGIVIADNASQLVSAPLYVAGVDKTSEYRVHVGRMPDGKLVIIGAQKKVVHHKTDGMDGRIWAGDGTSFVWSVNGQDAYIPPKVTAVALQAFEHFTELTFGALDIVFLNPTGDAYVLEINSAPTVTPETAKKYGEFFRSHTEATGKVEVAPLFAAVPVFWPNSKLSVWEALPQEAKEIIHMTVV